MAGVSHKIADSMNNPKKKKASYSNIQGKDESTAEFSALQFLWKFSVWAQRTGFNRPIIHIPVVIRDLFCIPLGYLLLKSKKKKILTALNILYPNLSLKKKKALIFSYLTYMGKFMYDSMFVIPIVSDAKVFKKHMKLENLHYLDEALRQGKGVILTTTHTGQLFHSLIGVSFHDMTDDPSRKYENVILAARDNDAMFKPITEKYDNIYPIVTAPFSQLREVLLEHLRENRVVSLYYDFSSPKQLATPFLDTKNSFLKPTPQSIASLHRESGAPIVPLVTIPQGKIQKSILRFLNPKPIAEICEKMKNAEKKEFHGLLSLTLNKLIHPYLLKMPHSWEELMAFATYTYKVKVNFDKGLDVSNFIDTIQSAIIKALDDTYEPNRNDTQLIAKIKSSLDEAKANLQKPLEIFNANKSYYRYYDRTATLQIKKLVKLSIFQLKKRGELNSAKVMEKLMEFL